MATGNITISDIIFLFLYTLSLILKITITIICFASRLISVLFHPSPQFLPFSFTTQAEHALITVTWYYQTQKPGCRVIPRDYLLLVFLPTNSRIERKEQHFLSEGMKIKNSV